MAEREGFEPSRGIAPPYRFSKPTPSASWVPLHLGLSGSHYTNVFVFGDHNIIEIPINIYTLLIMREKLSGFFAPTWQQTILFAPILAVLIFVLASGLTIHHQQQFSMLAQSLLHGKLYFLHPIGGLGSDPVFFGSHIYWSEGIFPALALVPFVAIANLFNAFFYQGYLSLFLTLGIIWFIYKLARKLQYSSEDSILFGLVFTLGSVFIGVSAISASWYYEQVVTTFLLFWGLYEFFGREKIHWWLLGVISGLLVLTRPTAAPIFIFFLLELFYLSKKDSWKWGMSKLLQLAPFVIASIGIVALYNYLRFHNIFETGFKYILLNPISINSRNLGTISPIHIPANLYSLLLRSPLGVLRSAKGWTLKFPFIENNSLGMSIFVTSPYFIYFFTRKWNDYKKREYKFLLIAALISLAGVVCYFGIGMNQYGYRYQLDFMPLLFYLFMAIYKDHHSKINTGMKSLMVFSIFFNFYLVLTYIF